MTTFEIGTELQNLIRSGKSIEAMEKLYAKDILSIEAAPMPDREVRGLDKCLAKSKGWVDAHEIHSASAEGPFPHGDKFALILKYDITERATGKRMKMEEVAVYTVANDKIVREEFMYPH
jgi:SnoaL-like domain